MDCCDCFRRWTLNVGGGPECSIGRLLELFECDAESPPPSRPNAHFSQKPLSGRREGPITESNWLWPCNRSLYYKETNAFLLGPRGETQMEFYFGWIFKWFRSFWKTKTKREREKERKRASIGCYNARVKRKPGNLDSFQWGFWKEPPVNSGFNYWVDHILAQGERQNHWKGHVNLNVSV